MKKVLSIIIVALLCLSIPLSLASCGVNNGADEANAAGYAYLSSSAEVEPLPIPDIEPRSESELLEIIADLTGSYSYRRIINIDNSAVSLRALFTNGDHYVAYTVTSTEYSDVETEGITVFYSDGACATTHILTWNTGNGEGYGSFEDNFTGVDNDGLGWVHLVSGATATSENYRNAIKAASNYIAKMYGTDHRNPRDIAAEIIGYLNGESNVIGLSVIMGAEGITDVFQDTISGSFIIHVNTYIVESNNETGIEAMIVIRDDMMIEHVAPIRYDFSNDLAGDYVPSDEEVYEYFRQFKGLTADTLYEVKPIDGCRMACDNFMMVTASSLDEAKEHEASGIEKFFESAFGSGVSVPHVILGLAVVLIAVIVLLVVLAIILLTPIVILAIIIIITIIIAVSVKKKKKKKLAAKKAAEEIAADEEKADTEPAEEA